VTEATHVYKIRIRGVASDTLRAAFDDVEVSQGRDLTILRTGQVDSATLYGLIARIESLGLDLLDVAATDSSDRNNTNGKTATS
jgi:hypothetical protein